MPFSNMKKLKKDCSKLSARRASALIWKCNKIVMILRWLTCLKDENVIDRAHSKKFTKMRWPVKFTVGRKGEQRLRILKTRLHKKRPKSSTWARWEYLRSPNKNWSGSSIRQNMKPDCCKKKETDSKRKLNLLNKRRISCGWTTR